MPMLDSRTAGDDIAPAHNLFGLATFLVVASTLGDYEDLASRVLVPIESLPGRERNSCDQAFRSTGGVMNRGGSATTRNTKQPSPMAPMARYAACQP